MIKYNRFSLSDHCTQLKPSALLDRGTDTLDLHIETTAQRGDIDVLGQFLDDIEE